MSERVPALEDALEDLWAVWIALDPGKLVLQRHHLKVHHLHYHPAESP